MTIAVDFDGVIHAYSRGWADGTIYDPPLPGALDGLRALMERDAVFIFTTRDISQVAEWLISHGVSVRVGHDGPFWNERGRLLVTNRKLAATAYLDDRAVRFESWGQALQDLGVTADGHTAARGGEQQDRANAAEAERDGAYRERAQLLAWLATLVPAAIAPAHDVDEHGWHLLYLNTPAGQLSWHIAPRDAAQLFQHVPYDPCTQWDGHTTDEKYARIRRLIEDAATTAQEPR